MTLRTKFMGGRGVSAIAIAFSAIAISAIALPSAAMAQDAPAADAAAAPHGERERSVRRFDAIGVRTKPSTCRDIGVR